MAFWLYTSGTTGTPKAVVHCHRTLLNCHHYGHDVLAIGPHDRVFATSKLFFAYALGNAPALPLFARGSCYLHPAWAEAPVVLQVLRDYRPTLFFSVPTVYARLLRAELPADAFRSTRLCVSAGERLPAEVYQAWRERFGVEILDGIGATETIFMFISNRAGRRRAGSTGTPVDGTELTLLEAARDPGAEAVALAAELMRLAERTLPSHQRPREIRIVEELPRTTTGKLQRFKLKEKI